TAYDVTLPAGTPYTVIVDPGSGSVELTGLTVSADATLQLLSTNFTPGLLNNQGAVEVGSDDLFLTQDIVNDGTIAFDTDTGAEDIQVSRGLTIGGTGLILFPDIASTTTTLHTINVPNLATTTIGSGQVVQGGPGEFRGGTSFPTDIVIDGELRADHTGKSITFVDSTTNNVLRVINNGIVRATNGGMIEFDDTWGIVNNGTLSCDPGATILFTTTTTDLTGTVIVDGTMRATNSLTFDGTTGLGTGLLDVGNGLTITGNANVGFGSITTPISLVVDNGATLVIQGNFSHAMTSEPLFNFNSTGALRMTGGSGLDPCDPGMPATLEVAGSDKGNTGSGFVNNFEIERLVIGAGANVMLVDAINNGNRNGSAGAAEALYVDELIFEDPSGRIILNGLRLYYNSISGTVGQLDAGADCNDNGQLDACDISMGVSLDCNGNGIPDECDIASGGSPDCNANGVPDECETGPDCNANQVPDECDISSGFSLDLNGNGLPDECENDCNLNGIPDDVDIASGGSEDCDGNGLPDECQGGFTTYTWIGASGGNWSFQPNWSPLGPPQGDVILANGDPGAMTTVVQTIATACALQLGSTGGGHTLQVNANASLYADTFTITSGGTLNPQGGTVEGGPLTVAAGATLRGYGHVLNEVISDGDVRAAAGQTLRLAGSTFSNNPGSLLEALAGAVLDVEATTVIQDGTLRAHANGAASFVAPLNNANGATLELLGGAAAAPVITNDSASLITGFGIIDTPVLNNDGHLVTIADSQATGDIVNQGTITVQGGTLVVLGTLTGSGTVIGDVSRSERGAPLPHGLFIVGDLAPSAGANLLLPSPDARLALGGDLDLPMTDHLAIDLVDATVHMNGLLAQSLEAMSEDIGAVEAGLTRAPGRFPIGTLRLGPAPTIVSVVDRHDNDGLGQAACEAVYVRDLVIEAGATLANETCRVYYQSLVMNGSVTMPANLIHIAPACPGDANASGTVDFTDLNIVLANWATTGPDGDVNGSGGVDFADLNEVLGNWGNVCK
ncbi:MAG: hypothetical protein KDA21_09605, partial [Phycisphaerales bacterium]|nr:hypothetical protein [Phycisphaerales bacterium]